LTDIPGPYHGALPPTNDHRPIEVGKKLHRNDRAGRSVFHATPAA
jgi:hypothetical protein